MRKFYAVFLAASCVSCTTQGGDPRREHTFNFNDRTITASRTLCLASARMRSKGPAIKRNTKYTLIMSVKGTTSSVWTIKCPPVVAGGDTACRSEQVSPESPLLTAGVGCPGWDSFQLSEDKDP